MTSKEQQIRDCSATMRVCALTKDHYEEFSAFLEGQTQGTILKDVWMDRFTCFWDHNSSFNFGQVDLIRQLGARLIFSSSGYVNKSVGQDLLDRISLTEFHSTSTRIWYQTLRNFTSRMRQRNGRGVL